MGRGAFHFGDDDCCYFYYSFGYRCWFSTDCNNCFSCNKSNVKFAYIDSAYIRAPERSGRGGDRDSFAASHSAQCVQLFIGRHDFFVAVFFCCFSLVERTKTYGKTFRSILPMCLCVCACECALCARASVWVFVWMEWASYIYISISKCVANSRNRDWLRQIFIKFLLISIMNFFHYYKMYFTLNALLQSLMHTTTTIKPNGRTAFYYSYFLKCLCNVCVCGWGCGCFIKTFTDKKHINRAAHSSVCLERARSRSFSLSPTIAQAIMHTHTFWICRTTTQWWANAQLFDASSQPANFSVSRFENCINRIFRLQKCEVICSHFRLFDHIIRRLTCICHCKFN